MDGEAAGPLKELSVAVNAMQRELAVIGERLANDRDTREMFTLSYERRHTELQNQVQLLERRLDKADSERQAQDRALTQLSLQVKRLCEDLESVQGYFRWGVYLVLGIIIMAVVGLVVGVGKAGR